MLRPLLLLIWGWVGLGGGLRAQGDLLSDSTALHQWTDSLIQVAETEGDAAVGGQLLRLERRGQGGSAGIRLAFSLGEYYLAMAQPDSALHWYEQAVARAEQAWENPTLAYTQSLNGQAIAYLQQGEYLQAYQLARQVLALRQPILSPQDPDLAQAYNNVGIIGYRIGRMDSCLYFMQRATEIWEQNPNTLFSDLLSAYNNLGVIARSLGNYHESVRWYQKVLASRDSLPPNAPMQGLSLSGTYNNLSIAYRHLGDFAQAVRYLRGSIDLELAHPTPDARPLGIKYQNLATLLLDIGSLDSALHYGKLGLAHIREQLGPDHALAYDSRLLLGQIYLNLGDTQRAREYFLQVKPFYEELYEADALRLSTLYEWLGRSYLEQGDEIAATPWLRRSLRIARSLLPAQHRYIKNSLIYLAEAYQPRQPNRALALLREALPPHAGGLTPADLMVARSLGEWHAERGDWQASSAAYALALDRLDTLRRYYQLSGSETRLFREARPLQAGALHTAIQRFRQAKDSSQLARAWAISEGSRALRLRETLQALQAEAFVELPPDLAQQEKNLRVRLTRINRQISRATEAAPDQLMALRRQRFALLQAQDSLLAAIATARPDYHRLRYHEQPTELPQLQQWLAEQDRDLVEYFIAGDRSYALVLRPEGLRAVKLPDLSGLAEQIAALRDALYRGDRLVEDPKAFTEIGRALYLKLWWPIAVQVPELREQVVVVPDGPLGYLPMGLLLTDSVDRGSQWNELPYLIRKHEISYAPAADWLLQPWQRRGQADRRLLAMAPHFEAGPNDRQGPTEATLAHHRREARAVSDLVGGEAWLNQAAHEGALKQSAHHYRLLHLSSHAAVNERFPLYSYVRLAPTKTEDGRLEIAELFGLNLDADLVVLSACETGLGRYQLGEGVLSLAQGFSYAGARSVLTTWWPVNDAASADLMEHFYQGMIQGLSRSAALRGAQLGLLDGNDQILSHPFFWAGYQLSGQPDNIELYPPDPSRGWIFGLVALAALLAWVRWGRNQRGK